MHPTSVVSKPAQLSVAARNAEALFEAKNVAEIRQIESRTRQDIEEKNLQLRQLVGDSYRDLIEGTDKIIDISTKCHSILNNILSIQEGFASLAVSVTAAPENTQDGKESVKKHRELHAVGSRVKFIMDTPEIIWGCLDAQEHLEAARRLLRVHAVHSQLHTAFAAVVATKFPVLSHQWQTVLKFRQHILNSALAALSSQPGLSSRAAADALAAVALLEGQDNAAALRSFLSARQQWVQHQLEQAAQGQGGERSPGGVLAELAQTVQSCIAQVGELFTAKQQPSMVSQQEVQSAAPVVMSLLPQLLHEEEADASELYFGSADGAAEGSSSPEAVQWRQQSAAFCQQLSPLQQTQVQQACSAWLLEVAASCDQYGLQLLQQCTDAESLLDAERAVHQAMAEWVAAPAAAQPGTAAANSTVSGNDQQQQAAGRLSRATSTALGAAAAASPSGSPVKGAGAGRPGRFSSDWEVTCMAVLGERLDLWHALFHAPFLERCKQLIEAALANACSSIEGPLAAALEQASLHDPEGAGQLQPGLWPSVTSSNRAATGADSPRVSRSVSVGLGPGAAGSLAGGVSMSRSLSLRPSGSPLEEHHRADFRNEVPRIQQLFDSQLHAALQAVLLLTGAPTGTGGQHAADNGSLRSLSPSRTTSLQPSSSNASMLRAGSLQPGSLATVGALGATAVGAPTAASPAAAAACTAAGKQRATELEAFAQQRCLELVQQLAGWLQQQLQGLPKPETGVLGASTVEQVLLLTRLCSLLAAHSSMLPALLGPAEAWPAAAKAGPHAGPSGSAAATSASSLPASLAQGVNALGPAAAALLRMHHPGLAGSPGSAAAASGSAVQLAGLQQQLHGIACMGYTTWAAWVGSSLAAELAAALAADELLFSDRTPLSWTETRLAAEGGADAASAGLLDLLEDAAAAGDMCFALPACPSASVLHLISRACWEVRRAGEHLITVDAIQLLVWEVHRAALTPLQQLLHANSSSSSSSSITSKLAASPTPLGAAALGSSGSGHGAPHLSEKGALQLLFDQRFLRDVLGGGKPAAAVAAGIGGSSSSSSTGANGSTSSASAAAATTSRRQLVTGVEQQLQEILDPIDWATYEPHLWSNVQRYYSRTAVLLGTLGQLNKPYGEAPRAAAGTAAAEINALNVLPVVPRFHYLPISTPTAASLPKQRSVQLSLGASTAAASVLLGAAAAAAAGLVSRPGVGAAATAVLCGKQQQLPLASINMHASDLAAQFAISDLGNSTKGLGAERGPAPATAGAAAAAAAAAASFLASHPTADTAAAAGASALSALQAKLQGSSFGAFGSMLGDRAAEVTAMAQNFGDLLPGAAGGLGGLGGGLLSSFARREASTTAGTSSAK